MSMLCSLVHGNSKQQPGVGAAPEDSIPSSSMKPEVPAEPAPTPVAAPSPAPAMAAAAAAAAVVNQAPAPVAQSGARFGQAYIKVIGCGGGGGNAISRMITAGLQVGAGAAWECSSWLCTCTKAAATMPFLPAALDASISSSSEEASPNCNNDLQMLGCA
jgi:hypothetical protein